MNAELTHDVCTSPGRRRTDRLRRAIVAQFYRPTGFWGRLAGAIMAFRPSNRERNEWTIDRLQIQPGERVLEIGFGPGYALGLATARVGGGLVAGIDHSEVMLRQASRRNAAAIRAGRLDLHLGSVESLPAFDEPFDAIYAVNSIGFWSEPAARLGELRDLLRPGGRLAFTVQPRSPSASDATARGTGEKIASRLRDAGFDDVGVELRPMRPVAAVCVVARRAC